MKNRALLSAMIWLASVLCTGAGTIVQKMDDIQYWVGTGTNRAALIIDWQDGKNAPGETAGQALVWGFRWSTGQSVTGRQMIEAIAAADPRLFLEEDFRSGSEPFLFGLAYDLDGDGGTFRFDHQNELGGPSDSDDHFMEGWEVNGYWNYRKADGSTSLPSFSISMTGFSTRTLMNNSWDAWVFTAFDLPPDMPDPVLAQGLAAVPEPSVFLSILTGAALLARRRSQK